MIPVVKPPEGYDPVTSLFFDNSMLDAWRRCHMYFTLRYVDGYTSNTSSPSLNYGSSWHWGMNGLYDGWSLTKAKQLAEEHWDEEYVDEEKGKSLTALRDNLFEYAAVEYSG
ncbi:hypothetical protein LCGC14_3116880, partial [marine sediment metagenome]